MKFITIEKKYRNAHEIYDDVIPDIFTDEDITDYVENFCDREPGGQSYGYSYSWDFLEDKERINIVLNKELTNSINKLKSLNKYIMEVENYIKTLNNEKGT